MGFERGHSKFGGRRNGTKNLKSRSASEIFDRLAFNSLEKAIELIQNETLEVQHRVGLLKEVIKYQFPQLRSIEHSGLPEQIIQIENKRQDIKVLLADPDAFSAIEIIEKKLKESSVESI